MILQFIMYLWLNVKYMANSLGTIVIGGGNSFGEGVYIKNYFSIIHIYFFFFFEIYKDG